VSRSDNTGKRNVKWHTWSLPRGTGRYLRRKWQKRQRRAGRAALRQQEEPEPVRPRHSVRYDYW